MNLRMVVGWAVVFGLALPAAQIAMLLEEKRDPVILCLGAIAPSQVSMYAQLEDQPRVILIGTYLMLSVKTFLDKAGLEERR